MSTQMSFSWMILMVVPLLGGVLLLISGLRTRRHGQTPHCRSCEYNLTGLTSERCPECGAEITPFTIVHGERHRRPGRMIAGAGLLLMAASLILGAAGNFDWYSYSPTAWIIYQTNSTDPATSSRAWNELDRRIKAGTLSAGQHAKLIDLALKEQGSTSKPMRGNLIDYLGDCYFKGRLSQAQQTLFFDQMTKLTLTVRPTVILGDSVQYQISHQSRSPSTGMWHRLGLGQDAAIDGKPLPRTGGGSCSSGSGGGGGSMGLSLEYKVPGKHTLKITPELTMFSGTSFDDKISTVLDKRTVPLEATFEILATEPPDYIRAVKDPSQTERLKIAITPTQYSWRKSSDTRKGIRYELDGQFEFRGPPVDVAFDVIARIDGNEYRMGGVHVLSGNSTNWGIGCGEAIRPEQAAKVDIILRGSKKVAQATVDQFSYWDGELIYTDVPVVTIPTTAPSS